MSRIYPSEALWDRYRDTHWGLEATRVWEVDDSDLPDELCEMGQLIIFECRDEEGPFQIEFDRRSERASLTFDLEKSHTIYVLLGPRARRDMRDLYNETPGPVESLSTLARAAGGRQAKFRQPRVRAKMVGVLEKVYYKTKKKGDGMSTYVHQFGEDSGVPPNLAVSRDGRLWVCGGNYTVPDGGITD